MHYIYARVYLIMGFNTLPDPLLSIIYFTPFKPFKPIF